MFYPCRAEDRGRMYSHVRKVKTRKMFSAGKAKYIYVF